MVRVQDIHVRVRPTFDWVRQISTIQATDHVPRDAMLNNPGWHLLDVSNGVLIFGWGDPDDTKG